MNEAPPESPALDFDTWLDHARIDHAHWEAALAANPPGGNLYDSHVLQVNSGTFWRCAHGLTGFGENMEWNGCEKCRRAKPHLAALFESHFENGDGI